jgi:hypothetical protein
VPCKSCGSVNQSKFSAEMGIHFHGLNNIDNPVVWIFPELAVCLDCGNAELLRRKLNCAYLQEAMTVGQGNLELSLSSKMSSKSLVTAKGCSSYLTENERLSVPHRCFGTRACLPRRERRSPHTHREYPARGFWLPRPRVAQPESRRRPYLPPTRKVHIPHMPQRENAFASPFWWLPQ